MCSYKHQSCFLSSLFARFRITRVPTLPYTRRYVLSYCDKAPMTKSMILRVWSSTCCNPSLLCVYWTAGRRTSDRGDMTLWMESFGEQRVMTALWTMVMEGKSSSMKMGLSLANIQVLASTRDQTRSTMTAQKPLHQPIPYTHWPSLAPFCGYQGVTGY